MSTTPSSIEASETPLEEVSDDATEAQSSAVSASGIAEVIQSYVLCHALFAIAETGLAARLVLPEGLDPSTEDDVDPELCAALLKYLAVRGIVASDSGRFRATDRGELLLRETVSALVGYYHEAYGPVLRALGGLLRHDLRYGADLSRDGAALGRHCEQLFRSFGTPLVADLVAARGFNRLIDLGCGTGGLLFDLCTRDANLTGIGIDIAPEPIELAEALASAQGVADRLVFKVADAFRPETWPPECNSADGFVAVGALHEHFRHGTSAVVDLLSTYAERMRETQAKGFLLCEPSFERNPLDIDFFLLHAITEQGFPRSPGEWLPLFREAGLACERLSPMPSTGFAFFCYVLVPTRRPPDA